jgi:hypothetical protein
MDAELAEELRELRRMYRELSLECHPDHGGDTKVQTLLNTIMGSALEITDACERLRGGDSGPLPGPPQRGGGFTSTRQLESEKCNR